MLSGIFLSVCVSYLLLSFVHFLRLFGAGRHGLSDAAQVAPLLSLSPRLGQGPPRSGVQPCRPGLCSPL